MPGIWNGLQVTATTSERDAARLNTPKLHELVRLLGEGGADVVMLIIKAMLSDFLKFADAGWTPDQVKGLISIIEGNYAHLTMAQWKLFFVKAKAGKMAQEGQRDQQTMIARITPIMVSQWLLNYSARCEEANELHFADMQRTEREVPSGDYIDPALVSAALADFVTKWSGEMKSISSERDERLRDRRKIAHERLLRQYCTAHNLNYEQVKSDYEKSKAP